MIITLLFQKYANFFAENSRKSLKIAIITLIPVRSPDRHKDEFRDLVIGVVVGLPELLPHDGQVVRRAHHLQVEVIQVSKYLNLQMWSQSYGC
jgi:hypothetical protein